MGKYVYPALIKQEESGYSVTFPDVSGCYTCGDTLADVIAMAEDALALVMYEKETEKESPPKQTELKNIICEQDEIATLIYCDTLVYRKMYDKTAVKKTLTIPNWLNVMAEEANINFSQLLQEALKSKLSVK